MDALTVSKNTIFASIVGGILGLGNTVIIIALMSMISSNQFVNLYVGGLFVVIGCCLLYRVYKRRGMITNEGAEEITLERNEDESKSLLTEHQNPTYKGGVGANVIHEPLSYQQSAILDEEWNMAIDEFIKTCEYLMSVAKILAGVLCILLEKHTFKHLNDMYKIPIYTLIGSSLSFLLVYSVMDVIELVGQLYHSVRGRSRTTYRPAILTNLLYLLMLSLACFLGGGLGIVYGVVDVEQLVNLSERLLFYATYREILSLTPIGFAIGISFGFLFGLIRAKEESLMPPLPTEEDEQEAKQRQAYERTGQLIQNMQQPGRNESQQQVPHQMNFSDDSDSGEDQDHFLI